MKRTTIISLAVAMLMSGVALYAQTGAPYIHDPSTIVECDGNTILSEPAAEA